VLSEVLLKSAIAEKPQPKFFVYYDEWSGEIIQVTNRVKPSKDPYIETVDIVAQDLLMGKLNPHKFMVAELAAGMTLVAKNNVVRLRRAENVLSKIPYVDANASNDINIVTYTNDWKMEVNLSQDTIYKLTGRHNLSKTNIINPEMGNDYSRIVFYVCRKDDPTFLIQTIEIDPLDLINEGYKIYDLSHLHTVCTLADISILTKRIFKSYGIKQKSYFTGSEYTRRKSQRRTHHKIVNGELQSATFTFSPSTQGWIIKSNFENPADHRLFRSLTLFFTDGDPNRLLAKIQIPYEKLGWKQEFLFHTDVELRDSMILTQDTAKTWTFNIEEI
jgi:hypothetical protein